VIHIRTWLNYDIPMRREKHPTRPELPAYHNPNLNLWLVDRTGEGAGWTFYPEGLLWGTGSTPDNAFERLLASLECEIHGPYPDPVRAQRAAELIADLETY
jgi:hypothetical protein